MLAGVFVMQPIGYILATLVAMMVTAGYGNRIPHDLSVGTCDASCIAAVDASWRIIIAIGAAPALMAIYFRRTIPESPLYTAYVLKRAEEARMDMSSLIRNASTTHVNGHAQPANAPAQALNPAIHPAHVPDEDPEDTEDEEDVEKFSHKWNMYWVSFRTYFFAARRGGSRHIWQLCGVSISWLLLDSSFYAMNASSTEISSKLFGVIPVGGACISGSQNNTTPTYGPVCADLDPSTLGSQRQSIYGALFANTWRSLIVISIGSLFGGSYMVYRLKTRSPRSIQGWGFFILIPLFIGAGLFLRFGHEGANIPAIIFYVLAQIFFEVGPNFTTFIIPAEMFPTRHRAFAHGIAAASGKVGASLFQLFYQFVPFWVGGMKYHSGDPGTIWLGFTILCFLPSLVFGVAFTYFLVPEMRGKGGAPRPLDAWEDEGEMQTGHALVRLPTV